MLSRLIITFLCAAAIGSVSGAFLTFDPAQISLKDLEISTSFSARLNSKPTEEVTVHLEHPFLSMSTCVIVFNPDNWNVPQEITGVPAPLFLGPSDLPEELASNSELLAKAVTVGPLAAELSSTDTLKITQSISYHFCSAGTSSVKTFDDLPFFPDKLGWYTMLSTRDLKIQIFKTDCEEELACITKVLARYGSTIMSMDVSGPAKGIREYPPTYVTSNTNGIRPELCANSQPNPLPPPTTTTTGTTTGTTTTATTTTTTTATTTTTTATTTTTTSITTTTPYSASTLPSSTSTIYPLPPAPSGYIPPPPPPPPDVVVEIQKCCQSIFNIPSCNAIVPAEPYIKSCISDAQTSGSYVLSDKVKQAYLAKCRTLTDDMILDPTKAVIDQGTKIKKECGFGNVTCINSCSGKGTCTDFGCACSPGFSGMDCSMDLTKATQYDPTVDQYRINVNITVVQEQMEQHSKLPVSVPYATPAPSVHSTPSVDQSLSSYVGSLPKPSTASPHIAKKSQPVSPDSYDDFRKPIISSSISLGSLRMVSVAAVVITSPKTVQQRHSFALMETLRTCGDSASLQKYVTRQLLDTSGFFKDHSFD
ncbi:hypothetical protein BASA62_006611 [Batrachochytrium salamandrivorans]|nr:hypothetical protein BASA62_006611 [Batrachochytrium salamandrivorans]